MYFDTVFAVGQMMKMVTSGQVVVIQRRRKSSTCNQSNNVDSITGVMHQTAIIIFMKNIL